MFSFYPFMLFHIFLLLLLFVCLTLSSFFFVSMSMWIIISVHLIVVSDKRQFCYRFTHLFHCCLLLPLVDSNLCASGRIDNTIKRRHTSFLTLIWFWSVFSHPYHDRIRMENLAIWWLDMISHSISTKVTTVFPSIKCIQKSFYT